MNYFVLGLTTVLAGVIFGFWPRGNILTLAVVALPFILASLGDRRLHLDDRAHLAQAVFRHRLLHPAVDDPLRHDAAVRVHAAPDPRDRDDLPLRWYAIAARRIVARGAGLLDVIGPMLILAVIFAVLLSLVRWRMKPRLG
jgi:hypothetical protein